MQKYNSKLKNLFKQKAVLFISSISIFVILTIFLIHPLSAQQEGQSIQVSPPSQELAVDPGETVTVKAKIRNATTKPLPIKVHIEDFTASGEEGQVALTQGGKYSVSSWTKVSPDTFSLLGGEEQEVTATITIPKDAAGGRYGSFVFGVDPGKASGKNEATVSQQIASLFLLRINGPTSEVMRITTFAAPKFSEFGPIPLDIQFTNDGNVHLKAYGLINITDMFGNKVTDLVVSGTNVFPGASRNVTTKLNKQFLFGPYTATAIMYYGYTQNQTITATTTFFVFPVRIAGAGLIILIILFLLRKRLNKAWKALSGK